MSTIIEKYNELQKEILSEFALKFDNKDCNTTFRTAVKRFYGFEKDFSWNILLNAFYIIDDVELAKKSFIKFDLHGPSRHNDVGERYLRLYGLLNAIYQQKLAIDNLLEIHKIDTKKELSSILSNSPIIEIRNKIGAHSANFRNIKEDSEHKFDVYEISRPDLQSDRIRLLRNQKDFEDFDIMEAIKSFDKDTEMILGRIIGKVLKKLFSNQGKFFQTYELIDKQKNGALIFGDTIVHFVNYNNKV